MTDDIAYNRRLRPAVFVCATELTAFILKEFPVCDIVRPIHGTSQLSQNITPYRFNRSAIH
jgi:hypothetical protein